MANPNKSFLTGTDAVMQWYDVNAKTCLWSVVDSKGDILFYYCGKDENESREHLENNIRMAEAQGVESTLTLRIHPKLPKSGYFDSKSERMIVTHFRPSSFTPSAYQPIQTMGYPNNQLLDEIRSLKAEISAIKMQQEMEEDEEEDEPEEENMLSGFMKNPAIQSMIISQISNLFSPQQKVTHVAGVLDGVESEQDQKIDEAIERLKKHDKTLGDDLLKLCEIAENDPMQWKMLLKMLRC